MQMTSKSGCIRRRLRASSILPAMLLSLTLPACGDKETAIDPSRLAEITRAREAADREKSQRLLSEDRLDRALWLAMLGAGGALVLGLAIGSSYRNVGGD